ncbi:hypothetical protein, partial [Actinomadura sp. WAC 06369]|uniref:hypothetical protein n=1 Tax=Actinomadura sp. WAC 06369 TaxID=2203193 RepID=UPI0010021970
MGRIRTRWIALIAGTALPLALAVPAARAVPDVRLHTEVTVRGGTTLGHHYALTYTVRVRATGGTAHRAALRLTTGRPAFWTPLDWKCETAGLRELRCPLGDVAERAAQFPQAGGLALPVEGG